MRDATRALMPFVRIGVGDGRYDEYEIRLAERRIGFQAVFIE